MKRIFLLSVVLHSSFVVPASAQMDASPGVARLSLVQGFVSAQRGDTGDWSAAALNQPLVGGDRISTGDHAQAEVQLDHANILRVGESAQVKIATLEPNQIQVQVRQGVVSYTIYKDSENEVEIDTPNVAIRPKSKEGVYRIEVDGFDTQVIVRTGAVDISTPQGTTHVEMGQAASVRGTADEVGNVMGGAPPKDNWDSWNDERDSAIRNAQSWNHTNRYYVGSEDLDSYGRWVDVPDYGQVWSPTVSAGWIPYRAGRWLWEPYWGWTWISYEPWGWAPYHYGRWFLYRSSWMWWPGPVDTNDYRPEWAPAYVSFFGLGNRREGSIGFGFQSVGWMPIGPSDHFYPWYGQYGSHFSVVNITDATSDANANFGFNGIAPLRSGNHFSNLWLAANDERVHKAVLTLPTDRFGTRSFAPRAVSRAVFLDGYMMTGNLAIVPGIETLSATNRPPSPSSLPRGAQLERFFTKKQPAAPHSLDEQVAQVKQILQGDGQIIPARQVTEIDATRTAPPMTAETSESGIERTVLPPRIVESEHTSKLPQTQSLRDVPSSHSTRPNLVSTRRTAQVRQKSRVAMSRSVERSRTSPSARISRSTSTATRRLAKLASASHSSAARTAQVYVDSANRQLDKGNYAAAIASYKRAWQVDRNNTAAKNRVERARRAMLAENKIITERR
jgi:hypothetical protein